MTRLPKLALAAALLAGVSGAAFAPALAKDKKADAAAGPKISPDILKQAQAAQTALQAHDIATAEPAVQAVEAGAKTDDDKYFAAQFRLQLEADKEQAARTANPNAELDETALKAPLEALIASPRTAPDTRAKFAFERAQISFNKRDYADATVWLTKAKQLGANDPQLDLALVRAKLESGDTAGGLADLTAKIDQMAAAGQKAPEDYYKLGLSNAMKKGTRTDSVAWMKRWLTAYPTSENWHTVLSIYAIDGKMTKLDRAQLIDVYRLMRQTKSLDQYGYEDYGQKTLDSGLPDEASTVITEGKAVGKVPSTGNGPAILADAKKAIAADLPLTSLETKAKSSADGKLAAQTADAYFGKGNFAKAVPLYQLALQKGGVKTDDVNTHLGIALAMNGDKAGAKAAFGNVTAGSRGEIAGFWSFYIDHPIAA